MEKLWYNNQIIFQHTSIPKNRSVHWLPMLTVITTLVMVGGVLRQPDFGRAAESVCGDSVKEGAEMCDDGNLLNGDGCSSACTVEACGNGKVDAEEQCDDGNVVSGDGCNTYCQIEFCGDHVVQVSLNEQCDDGNGISGDGCTSACFSETSGQHQAPTASSESSASSQPSALPIALPLPPAVPLAVVQQAVTVTNFLQTDPGREILQYLDRVESLQLEAIVQKLSNGRRLTSEERTWVQQILEKLELAKVAERTRYTDLLKAFIATPISTEVVDEKTLEKERLVDVQVPVAIDELKRAVAIIRRGDLQNQVALHVSKLKRQGIDLTTNASIDYQTELAEARQPIAVFAALKALKEEVEQYATNDVPGSLTIIRTEAALLRKSLPVLEQEYGVRPEDMEPLLASIESVSHEVTKQDLDRVVAAVNRFIGVLERDNVISKADIASIDLQTKHTAASVRRLAEQIGSDQRLVSTIDMAGFVDGLSQTAPPELRHAFENGAVEEQRDNVLAYLAGDQRVQTMLETMRRDGRSDVTREYELLRIAIRRVGENADTVTTCDDSMTEALRCTNDYLITLQDAVRGRSFFSRTVGYLQDFFGIGS